ncbi:MAG: hypothetical protein M0Z43_03065 [Acidithiobacillus sp.]|nr:hypothetical protein [Acidithiobacillus sp.]
MGHKIRFFVSILSASALFSCVTASAEPSTNAMQNAIKSGSTLFASTSLGRRGNSCMTCHRGGGRSEGILPNGKSIPSLIGAAATFPHYNKRSGRVITMDMQINSCIKNALLGEQLPYDSRRMVDLVSYLTSLSQGKKINVAGDRDK